MLPTEGGLGAEYLQISANVFSILGEKCRGEALAILRGIEECRGVYACSASVAGAAVFAAALAALQHQGQQQQLQGLEQAVAATQIARSARLLKRVCAVMPTQTTSFDMLSMDVSVLAPPVASALLAR